MSRKKYPRKSSKPYPIIPMAAGLFFFCFAFVAMASPWTRNKEESLSSVVPVSVNLAAPELTLENINGQTESLATYRGNVVLVNNWATWCPPCKAEMPTLAAYYDEHRSEGFTIIAIEAGDSLEVVGPFVQSY